MLEWAEMTQRKYTVNVIGLSFHLCIQVFCLTKEHEFWAIEILISSSSPPQLILSSRLIPILIKEFSTPSVNNQLSILDPFKLGPLFHARTSRLEFRDI